MRSGGERLIISSASYAFGARPYPGIGADEEIVFHIRLQECGKTPAPPHLPDHDAADYERIGSDLMMLDEVVGTGPAYDAGWVPTFHYSAYRRDGEVLFDSTWVRGESWVVRRPETLLSSWRAGLEGMRVGGRRLLRVLGAPIEGLEPGEWVIFDIYLLDLVSSDALDARSKESVEMPIRMEETVRQSIRPRYEHLLVPLMDRF